MKATITIDDRLWERAQEYAGDRGDADIVNTALRAYVEREAARRLARLGGSQPDLMVPSRRNAE